MTKYWRLTFSFSDRILFELAHDNRPKMHRGSFSSVWGSLDWEKSGLSFFFAFFLNCFFLFPAALTCLSQPLPSPNQALFPFSLLPPLRLGTNMVGICLFFDISENTSWHELRKLCRCEVSFWGLRSPLSQPIYFLYYFWQRIRALRMGF